MYSLTLCRQICQKKAAKIKQKMWPLSAAIDQLEPSIRAFKY